MRMENYVEILNDKYFEGKLSKKFRNKLENIPIDRPDVLSMVERMFRLINNANIPATDLSEMLGEILGTLLGRILPSAWEDRIPPVTVPGRHAAIDKYIKMSQWNSKEAKSMMDIGCGFPPYTTIDTANYFPDWNIFGVDPSLPKFLVHDESGNYATFSEGKSIVYFQPSNPTIENWDLLLKDKEETKSRFYKLLNQLDGHPSKDKNIVPRLELDPIKIYEQNNLSFIIGGIGAVDIKPVDVIRCFNVLFYFNNAFFLKALSWFKGKLTEGGLLFIGGNWAASTESFYAVYQKEGDVLHRREFAFSIDCICPFSVATWYANHDDDQQAAELTKYVKMIRQDDDFMKEFYAFHDLQRAAYGICPRDSDGYYDNIDSSIAPEDIWPSVGKILEELNENGFNDKAIQVLRNSGVNAKLNEVGHLSILF